MKISKKAYYGLRAVLSLARAVTPLSIHTIAETEALPEDYLEKILQTLRRKGLVEARKGTAGGYRLVRPAEVLSVWEVFEALDGPVKMVPPQTHGTLPCLQVSHCQSNQVWRILEQSIESTLKQVSIASLLKNNNSFPDDVRKVSKAHSLV